MDNLYKEAERRLQVAQSEEEKDILITDLIQIDNWNDLEKDEQEQLNKVYSNRYQG